MTIDAVMAMLNKQAGRTVPSIDTLLDNSMTAIVFIANMQESIAVFPRDVDNALFKCCCLQLYLTVRRYLNGGRIKAGNPELAKRMASFIEHRTIAGWVDTNVDGILAFKGFKQSSRSRSQDTADRLHATVKDALNRRKSTVFLAAIDKTILDRCTPSSPMFSVLLLLGMLLQFEST